MRPRPHRAVVLMLGVAVAVIPLLLMAGGGDSLANQSGPGMSDRLGNLNALCRLNGGTPGAYATDSIVTRFSCTGGALDGLYCDVYADLTYCYWERVGHGAAAGGGSGGVRAVTVQVRDLTFVTDLASDPVFPFGGVVPTAPMTAEVAVSRNASDAAATEARQVQINGCRHLGGTERVAGDPGVVAETITIGCSAGLLDGMWCTMGATSNTCFLDRSTPGRPLATTTRAPAPDRPATATVPATVPSSRTEATEATTLPTATVTPGTTTMPTPTSMPPTEVPVIEPTFVDPTVESPWTLPDGTFPPLEPAPTPTGAPIL